MNRVEPIAPIVKLNLLLCDYSDTYILMKAKITVANSAAADATALLRIQINQSIFEKSMLHLLHEREHKKIMLQISR